MQIHINQSAGMNEAIIRKAMKVWSDYYKAEMGSLGKPYQPILGTSHLQGASVFVKALIDDVLNDIADAFGGKRAGVVEVERASQLGTNSRFILSKNVPTNRGKLTVFTGSVIFPKKKIAITITSSIITYNNPGKDTSLGRPATCSYVMDIIFEPVLSPTSPFGHPDAKGDNYEEMILREQERDWW